MFFSYFFNKINVLIFRLSNKRNLKVYYYVNKLGGEHILVWLYTWPNPLYGTKGWKNSEKGNSLNIYHITHVICCNVIEMAALPYRVKCQRFPLLAHKWHSYAMKIIPWKCGRNRKEERMKLKMNNTCFFFGCSKCATKCLIFAERYFCRAIWKNCLLRQNKL